MYTLVQRVSLCAFTSNLFYISFHVCCGLVGCISSPTIRRKKHIPVQLVYNLMSRAESQPINYFKSTSVRATMCKYSTYVCARTLFILFKFTLAFTACTFTQDLASNAYIHKYIVHVLLSRSRQPLHLCCATTCSTKAMHRILLECVVCRHH